MDEFDGFAGLDFESPPSSPPKLAKSAVTPGTGKGR